MSNRRRKSVRLLLGVVIVITFVAAPVTGFFPLDFVTSILASGRSHEDITWKAIEAVDRELFDVSEPTQSMRVAIYLIALANAWVDLDQVTEKHFDGENFPGGQAWISSKRAEIISSLQVDNSLSARLSLGHALHTLQDFYSHSNWVELHGATVNPQLGGEGTVGPTAGSGETTCKDCDDRILPLCNDCSGNLTTSLLTSGYYNNDSRAAGKCDHGGPFDSSATDPVLSYKFGINKDSASCVYSPRYDLHHQAAQAAEDATRAFIRALEDELTPRQMRLLLGGGPTLAIAIDTTGSMGPIIVQVKTRAVALIDARLGTLDEPSKYVLVPFNDPNVGPVTVTTDPEELKSAILSLRADGGGDCPEMAYTGMLRALGAMDTGGNLFVFTDASAKDAGRAGEVASLAIESGVSIQTLRFGTCSSGLGADEGQRPARFTKSGWRTLGAASPDFDEVTLASGGQVFDLLLSEAEGITSLADLTARSNNVAIASLATTLTGGLATWSVPADSTLKRITFSVSGTPDVMLRRPDGSQVLAGESGVEAIDLTAGRIVSVRDPASGSWTIELAGSGPVSIEVSGESPLDLVSFDFVEIAGRPGHDGWYPITGLPVRETQMAAASLAGDFSNVSFELRRKDGTVLRTPALERGPGQSDSQFGGEVSLPSEPFLIYAVGTDSAATPFQRLLPGTARRQTVEIRPRSIPAQLHPGQTADMVFRVTNLGTAGDFTVSAADDKGYVETISPASFTLDAEGEIDVAVRVVVPADAPPGSADTVTAVVRRVSDPTVTNFAVASSSIITAAPDVTLTKTAVVSGPPRIGGEITYTLTVTNTGPGLATGLVVTDSLPAEVELIQVVAPCAAEAILGGTVAWNIGTLAPAESLSCDLVVRVARPGLIVNTASASLAETDLTPANNSDSAEVNVENAVTEIPTLSSLGLGLMAAALALGGALRMRRSRGAS